MVKKFSQTESPEEYLKIIGGSVIENLIGKAAMTLLKAGQPVTVETLIKELTEQYPLHQAYVQPAVDFLSSCQKPE